MAVYAVYLNQMLQIRWRRWLTDNYLVEWLSDRAYYQLQLSGNPADNPDQRISDDMKFFVDQSLDLSLGFLNAVVTLGSFVGILWGLSGPAEIPVNGTQIVIPGYMVWAALIYAIVGTWLTHKIGKKLIGLNFDNSATKPTSASAWFGSAKIPRALHSIKVNGMNCAASARASATWWTTGGAS
jgi:putative ATP-binding cassette transporter